MAKKKGLTIMPQQYNGVVKRATSIVQKAYNILPSDSTKKPFYFLGEVNDTISELDAGIGKVETYLNGLSSDSSQKDKYISAIEQMKSCKSELEKIRDCNKF